MSQRYKNFREFYPFYLAEHQNPMCRRLHFIGSWLVLLTLAAALVSLNWHFLIAVPFLGYGFAWVGHFFFEKNRPATFKYPLFSLLGDWVMFADILRGKIPL